ncbi:uncharacterized protein BO80DRAFT_421629 [Aspergillus ibericus CBS 121593]|uniref:Uncharacterized protein n=1 Tax=Aspergillus ibericus CBS 121593 TaxID=1448316 RepID=A0A395HCV3_9EURO|nr:hypothetical protein BO80DRAFT_421629 [Aspergillus ibericus CBS 121593]RAL04985.1 hypothetical protein BO80DRAFT_421629 [Aspergillus ibericus CBS 121593]
MPLLRDVWDEDFDSSFERECGPIGELGRGLQASIYLLKATATVSSRRLCFAYERSILRTLGRSAKSERVRASSRFLCPFGQTAALGGLWRLANYWTSPPRTR